MCATGETREDETSYLSYFSRELRAAILWAVLPMPQTLRDLLENFVDEGLTNECIGNHFP
jgi:hypothetical protein